MGFVVSMMLKHADAMLKGFSRSIAVVLATVISFFMFDTALNGIFVVGASMVGLSVRMNSYYGGRKDLEERIDMMSNVHSRVYHARR